MWGSDYPHDEGTYPYTREHLRQVFPGRPVWNASHFRITADALGKIVVC